MRTGIGTALIAAWVVLLLVGSLSPASAHPSPSLPARSTAGLPLVVPSASPHWCATVPTFSPVVIPSGNTTYWNGSGRESTCFQQGSVTIENGGTLIIQNVTLSMVQFVAVSGTLAERLSNISRVVDAGTMVLRSAVITTDANVTNPYLKLNFTVTGDLSLWNSSLAFPGWFNVEHGARVVLNNSTVKSNPASGFQSVDRTIIGDTSFAPTVDVSSGAEATLVHSQLSNTYADNVTTNGSPGPLPLSDNSTVSVTPSSNYLLNNFQTPTGTESLIQDWLYPIPFPAGDMLVYFSMSTGTVTTSINVSFNGTRVDLGDLTLTNQTGSPVEIAFPQPLLAAINRAGPYGLLASTGSFDHNPPFVSVTLNATGIGSSTAMLSKIQIVAVPNLVFDLRCEGPATVLQAVGSTIDLNWNALPASPSSNSTPLPWESNKLDVSDSASVFLANLSVPTPLPSKPGVSAVQADETSKVVTYRWAEFGATGPGGWIPGARVDAFSTGQGPENATVTALNDLAKTVPAIWGYVQWWDAEKGLPAYGETGAAGPVAGRGFLLLAGSNLTGTDSSPATFLGSYHIVVRPPISSIPPQWSFFNVTPYPNGLVNASPDQAPTAYFPLYRAALTIVSLALTADRVPTNGTVRIGQLLGVSVEVENLGATAVENLSGMLEYVPRPPAPAVNVTYLPTTPRTIPAGGVSYVNFTWRVNETVVGEQGSVTADAAATVDWNGGPRLPDGGAVNASASIEVRPSSVAVLSLTSPPHSLAPDVTYSSTGAVVFNGSGYATVNLTATPASGGTSILLATNLSRNGTFALVYSNLGSVLQAGVPYVLQVVASYNTAHSTPYVLAGSYSLAPAPSTGSAIPWWVWTLVAVGVVVGVAIFLVRRRRPAPQLECGVCASLVPVGSTSCPDCGTVFDLQEGRCPRCGGSIPVGLLACPQCRYQPSDRPGPIGPEADREAYHGHLEQFRAASQGELGEDYPEVDFWRWWRRQPSFQTFRDWKTGQSVPPHPEETAEEHEDTGLEGIGGGR